MTTADMVALVGLAGTSIASAAMLGWFVSGQFRKLERDITTRLDRHVLETQEEFGKVSLHLYRHDILLGVENTGPAQYGR